MVDDTNPKASGKIFQKMKVIRFNFTCELK